MASRKPIPILMYHSVGRPIPGWKSPWFSLPARVFADHLMKLSAAGYRSVTLGEVRAYVAEEVTLPARSVALTFDDGYVDNWTYVVPLLQRYGFTGAVFVTPEFVDPRDVVRPTLDDTGFEALESDVLENRGFMSWRELEIATAAHTLSVESHGLTHTWYPTGPEVVDFHRPGDWYPWLDWNSLPKEKPFYVERLGDNRVPWGTPVYRHGKSLEVTRYSPDPVETERLTAYVAENGNESFFSRAGWREALRSKLEDTRKGSVDVGRYESADERTSRYRAEIETSRTAIEERLGRRPGFFVFPGGGYNDESFEIARAIYSSVAVRSPENETIVNAPGGDPSKMSRRGTQLVVSGARAHHTGGTYLVEYLRELQGSVFARRRRQGLKLLHLMGLRLGFWG